MRIAGLSVAAAAILVTACTTMTPASAKERQAKQAAMLAHYEAAAGAPVSSIQIFGTPSWEAIDGSHLVYVLSPRRQYLMTLGGNCMDWATGPSVGIGSSMGMISTRLDAVHVSHGLTCSIERIQPLDIDKLKVASASGARSG